MQEHYFQILRWDESEGKYVPALPYRFPTEQMAKTARSRVTGRSGVVVAKVTVTYEIVVNAAVEIVKE